jgi:hypothetical protein
MLHTAFVFTFLSFEFRQINLKPILSTSSLQYFVQLPYLMLSAIPNAFITHLSNHAPIIHCREYTLPLPLSLPNSKSANPFAAHSGIFKIVLQN